jgi:transposase
MSDNYAMTTLDLTPHKNDQEKEVTLSRHDLRKMRKMRVAVALAEGQTETEAARLVGVNRTTIYRWHQEVDFVAELNRLKRESLAEHRAKLRSLLDKATQTLESCLERPEGDMIKMKAAMFIVSRFASRAYETIGPITERGVQKVWTDEATRASSSEQVQLVRVTVP